MTIAQIIYRMFVSFVILVVFLCIILYSSGRNVNLVDFIVFIDVECLIIINMIIWLHKRQKKINSFTSQDKSQIFQIVLQQI